MEYPFESNPDIEYLKTDDIGEIIAEACAQVYIKKPKYPIDFVGKWLQNFCKTQRSLRKQGGDREKVKLINQRHEREKVVHQKQKVDEKVKIAEIAKKEEKFKKKIVDHPYPEELLEELPQFLADKFQLSGVYIGNLFPFTFDTLKLYTTTHSKRWQKTTKTQKPITTNLLQRS